VYAYDPAANAWSTNAPLPLPYSGGTVAVVNGIIYAIGGTSGSQAAVQSYYPSTDSWATKASMPTPRYLGARAALNGIIYVAGGYSSTGAVATVEAYNPATDIWSTVGPLPFRLWAASATTVNGTLYVMGGFDVNNAPLASVEAFTPNTSIVGIATYAGLTLAGSVGSTNRIDYKNDLAATNWNVLTNLTLLASPYLSIDPTPAYGAKRFYRVVEQ
jgi:N-acetylneuraminic acid mutarotase